MIDPFLGIDHAWMSAPTFPPHPHAGFSAVTYLFLDSETGIANPDSPGNSTLIQPGGGAGAELQLLLAAGQRAYVMPINGRAEVNSESFGLDNLSVPILPAATEATTHKLVAKPGGAKVAVFIGEPLHEPVLSNGPMAFASQESLTAATAAYQRGDLGRL
ncbi:MULTISPECIES: pirin-like C-terminal cupin domain-containing protein [unclassified Variovorax]|uniref:pirin-like C-terminal cupin domain-containing protein n=1 Tax=unclassified Variovorax TaxID=663243 RepID=UPI003F50F258